MFVARADRATFLEFGDEYLSYGGLLRDLSTIAMPRLRSHWIQIPVVPFARLPIPISSLHYAAVSADSYSPPSRHEKDENRRKEKDNVINRIERHGGSDAVLSKDRISPQQSCRANGKRNPYTVHRCISQFIVYLCCNIGTNLINKTDVPTMTALTRAPARELSRWIISQKPANWRDVFAYMVPRGA